MTAHSPILPPITAVAREMSPRVIHLFRKDTALTAEEWAELESRERAHEETLLLDAHLHDEIDQIMGDRK
jgi:hypothetical protein